MTRTDSPMTADRDAIARELAAVVRRHDPGWTGGASSDPGVQLLEVWGWVADRLGEYQDRIGGESSLAASRPWLGGSIMRADPYRNFKFRVKWDGTFVAGITRVFGFTRAVQPVEYRDGADPDVARRAPGRLVYEPITLERPLGGDTAFEDWATRIPAQTAGGQGTPPAYRKNIRVELLNQSAEPVLAYDVYGCWPSAYRTLIGLSEAGGVRLVESLTVVPEGWQRDKSVVWPAPA